MNIKNLKVNKALVAARLLSTAITATATGCAPQSDCDINEFHLHRYEKAGVVRYIEDESLKNHGYEWTDDVVYVDEQDKEFYDFLEKKGLLKIDDNISYLMELQDQNQDYKEYRYAYTYLLPIPHVFSNGKQTITTFTYIPTTHYSWTADRNHSRLTGEERNCHYVYTGYKVEKNDKGKYVLIEREPVDDILSIRDEYPYFKEKVAKVVNSASHEELDYEDGSRDDEDKILSEEEAAKYEEGKEYKNVR